MLSLSMCDDSCFSMIAGFVCLLTVIVVLFGRVDFSGPGLGCCWYSSLGVPVLFVDDEISN